MKKSILFIASFFASMAIFAQTVKTVSNHSLGGAQYSNILDAYNAASANDTLLFEGTTAAYATTSLGPIDKPLVMIGQGLNTQKQQFQPTMISYLSNFNNEWKCHFTSGSGGSKVYGITFTIYVDIAASGITFENCKFDFRVRVSGNNITFKNCIFVHEDQISLVSGAVNNLNFSGCIFNHGITGSGSLQNVLVDHCLFLASGSCFNNCNGFDVRNSIFMNTAGVSGITSGTFQNNLLRLSSTFPPVGNTDGGGNLVGSDPMFVTYTAGQLYASSHDYHLQTGSPAIGAGSDATDIGLHGGLTQFSETGEPLVAPVVRSMNILNSIIAPSGTIHVQITASKPDND